MADHQNLLAAAAVVTADQVASPVHFRRHLEPLGCEAKCVKLSAQYDTDLAHPGMIHRAARDIDRFGNQCDGVLGVPVDPRGYCLLGVVELLGCGHERQYQKCRKENAAQ